MSDMEKRIDKLEAGFHQLAINQAETNTVLREVAQWVKTERSNSGRLNILENNWKWAKGILTLFALPLLWLVIKSFIS